MSKRTIALIIGLFLLTALLTYVAVNQQAPKQTQAPATVVSPKDTVLTIVPVAAATPSAASSKSAEVNIATGKNKVTAVQLELSYDVKVLTDVDIIAGTFFENPATLVKDINEETGRIFFATAINPGENGVTGNGVIAKITYRTLATSSATTTIRFLPQTQVAAEGETISVLKQAVDGVLTLEPSAQMTPQPTNVGTSSAQ